MWYPGPGVVIDCNDACSLPSSLLCCCFQFSVVDCWSVWRCQCRAGDSVYSRAFYLHEKENGEQISTTAY